MDDDATDVDQTLGISKETFDWHIKKGVFTVVSDLLYFTDPETQLLRLCIPEALEKEVLSLVHQQGGHFGMRKTYLSVKSRFYLHNMYKKVKRFIDTCKECAVSKPSHQKPSGHLYPIPTPPFPFHTLSLDFITALPESKSGHNSILTLVDKFSKIAIFIPCRKDTDAEEAAKLYLQHVYPRFGLPEKFISDRDARFTSHFWQTLMKLLKVDLGLTAAYHPSADGQAEKMNQVVETALRCWLARDSEDIQDWPSLLPIIEFEYNSSQPCISRNVSF
jgi:Integrase core domain.